MVAGAGPLLANHKDDVGALPDQEVLGTLTRIAPQAIEKDNAKLFEVVIVL